MYNLECLNIYLGWACNLHCKHCWVSADNNEHEKIDVSLVLQIIEEAALLGLELIKISGGEPFLYPEDMTQIINCANRLDLNVNIESNGTIICESVLKLFNPQKTYINISLDGYDADSHNEIRGRTDAFQRTLTGIKQVQTAGIPFGIIHTIHDGNVQGIDSLIGLLNEISVNELKLNPVMTIGRARRDEQKYPYLLGVDNMVHVFEQYNNCIKDNVHVSMMVPPCFIKPYQIITHKKDVRTCGYLNMLSILPDGSVGLCGEAKDLEIFQFGNIRDSSIRIIWNDSKNLQTLRKETEKIGGVCSKCNYMAMCKGGCRIAAYISGNEVGASNPIAEVYYKEHGNFPGNLSL